MMKKYEIRKGTAKDLAFLKEMLYEAVFWSPEQERIAFEELFEIPEISNILKDWPHREGDSSLIAMNEKHRPIGAAWYRFWSKENYSYGFVDVHIPELGVAVIKKYRGKGLGRELMIRLIDYAKSIGINQISLSVDPRNYALRLYEKLGFRKVSESGTSLTMLKDINEFI